MFFIRKKDLDDFLVTSLITIKNTIKSNYEYIKNPKDELDSEIKEDYLEANTLLSEILEKVHSVDDLGYLNEDDIDFVYQCLALYEGEFTITHRNEQQRKIDEQNYKKLQKLLNLFY